jgi:hypothetical protein
VLRRSKVEVVVEHGVSRIVFADISKKQSISHECFNEIYVVASMVSTFNSACSDGGVLGDDEGLACGGILATSHHRQPEVNTILKTAHSSSKHFDQTFTSIQTHAKTSIHLSSHPRAQHGFPRRQVQSTSAEGLPSDS